MVSENPQPRVRQRRKFTSENRTAPQPLRRGRAPIVVPAPLATTLEDYIQALSSAPLAELSRKTYISKVRQYLIWLAATETNGDPLGNADARDWAVRDYRTHLLAVAKAKPATVNNALAAIDDFYIRRHLGPTQAARADVPVSTAPRSLSQRGALRYLRAVETTPSPRDRAIALVAFYAGARIGEIVALDTDDVAVSARKANLRIYGKGAKVREVPVHRQLRSALTAWLDERHDWPGAELTDALFLNQRGVRLSVKGAHNVITGIGETAGLDDHTTAHVLRHTFATTLVRGGTDLVIVAELLGHARIETTRGYTRPTADDRLKALDQLIVDE